MNKTLTQPDYTIDVPRMPRQWAKAFRHFRNLMANKEDTSQVFHINMSLNGNDLYKSFNEFVAHPEGRKRFEERRVLPPILDDRERLLAMPQGSLAHAYREFMDTQGLSAQGLIDEYEAFSKDIEDTRDPDFRWYNDRLRDTHDLTHVLTGYSRDALGETSVLAFSYQQHRGFGNQFIAYMGAYEVKRAAPKGAPVFGSIREAARRGRAADKIEYYDILDLLPRPLEEVQAMLGITPATQYDKVHEMMRAAGIDPYEAISPQKTEPAEVLKAA